MNREYHCSIVTAAFTRPAWQVLLLSSSDWFARKSAKESSTENSTRSVGHRNATRVHATKPVVNLWGFGLGILNRRSPGAQLPARRSSAAQAPRAPGFVHNVRKIKGEKNHQRAARLSSSVRGVISVLDVRQTLCAARSMYARNICAPGICAYYFVGT